QLALEFIDAGLGGGAVQGVHDLIGLAVEGLPRLLTILSHPGNLAVLSEENGEGTGDALRDRGHGNALRQGQSREDPTIAHVPMEIVHRVPPAKGDSEKVPTGTAPQYSFRPRFAPSRWPSTRGCTGHWSRRGPGAPWPASAVARARRNSSRVYDAFTADKS